ncbi:NUDIX domain-containing protein [Bacillus salacetis]|uniref:NUDIX domain-containing protein n=1 Tax=Bacillus salacetis TaxID=2315464 RepID=A0A3A1R6J9_9BACI|nr:NUDIX domain-containing protein [Bacillus salacetis]RIW35117.1 NUDIX domain-containing protein [Bacillus salacetis]
MSAINKTVVAVKGMVVNDEGKVLIVQRSLEDAVGAGSWEFPGGKIDFGEDLEAALYREIKEETNLESAVERILFAVSFKTDPNRQVVLLTYLCRTKSASVSLSEEHMDYHWVEAEQLRAFLPDEIIAEMEAHKVFLLDELKLEEREALS